jgi:5-methylcytosine-specific restriction endonuclease McrBC GTP-binding regulatory subunit McrB
MALTYDELRNMLSAAQKAWLKIGPKNNGWRAKELREHIKKHGVNDEIGDDLISEILDRAGVGGVPLVSTDEGRAPVLHKEEDLIATAHPDGNDVGQFCQERGFYFQPDLIARYLAALLTKPFVILAGISGTGKSKLAQLVAEFYCIENGADKPQRRALVPVRPDWIDNQSILGFVNPVTGTYESTQTLDLILLAQVALSSAEQDHIVPRHFLLLDEMNLARVEYYFSDWLACTETRSADSDGRIKQQLVRLHSRATGMEVSIGGKAFSVPDALELPTNLVVTGTVNVDETTYGFSPKVLDRAMVLEFDEVDLEQLRNKNPVFNRENYRFPNLLPAFQLPQRSEYASLPENIHRHIQSINDILEESRLHLGYRTAIEMARFMTIYNEILPPSIASVERWLKALDVAILQKVLPRLSGNRAKLLAPLSKLCCYFHDPSGPVMDKFDNSASAQFEKSYRRAGEMWQALVEFGFVSFFK